MVLKFDISKRTSRSRETKGVKLQGLDIVFRKANSLHLTRRNILIAGFEVYGKALTWSKSNTHLSLMANMYRESLHNRLHFASFPSFHNNIIVFFMTSFIDRRQQSSYSSRLRRLNIGVKCLSTWKIQSISHLTTFDTDYQYKAK